MYKITKKYNFDILITFSKCIITIHFLAGNKKKYFIHSVFLSHPLPLKKRKRNQEMKEEEKKAINTHSYETFFSIKQLTLILSKNSE